MLRFFSRLHLDACPGRRLAWVVWRERVLVPLPTAAFMGRAAEVRYSLPHPTRVLSVRRALKRVYLDTSMFFAFVFAFSI